MNWLTAGGAYSNERSHEQLERRSEFSKDLRVRYAHADINLALEGWQKNEQAADLLIQRAQSDRATAPGRSTISACSLVVVLAMIAFMACS